MRTQAEADRIGAHEAFAGRAALFGEGAARVDPRRALALQRALGNHQFSRLVPDRAPPERVVFRQPVEGFAGEPGRDAEQRALSLPEGGAPIPAPLRSALAGVVAVDLEAVRIHTDEQAAATARELGARALTVEHDISFAAGEYAPHTPEGLRLLVHELKHVEQHARGLRPGTLPGRAIGDPHDALEQEADLAAQRVAAGPLSLSPTAPAPAPARPAARPRRAVRGASPVIMRQPRADAAGDRIEVIEDRAKHKLRVVRVDKTGRIVAGLAEITPPKGESLEAAKVEAKLHETSRLTDARGTYKIKLPPRYTATTNPKETVQLRQTTAEELARKEADRQKVEAYLAAQDEEFGTNLAFLYAADLADEDKVAALMRTEGYQQFAQKRAEKQYWTEVRRLMELDRESIKEGYLAGGVVLSDREADDTWVDRELEKPWDEQNDRPKPHMSALQQWEARNRARIEERLYVQGKRAQARGFAEEQARIMAHRVEPGATSSAAEKQEAREWAALAGHDLADDDAVARQINAQVRAHQGDLLELATKEAAWAAMHHGQDSPEARRWRTILNAHAAAMKAGGFDAPWRPNMAQEARQDAEDAALRQQFARLFPGFEEGLSVKEMREILRRGRSRDQLSSWEREHLDKHGSLPNEVTDERGILQGYKLYSYEQLGLNGGVGQVTEEIVDVAGKRVSITKTVTLTPAVAFFEDLSRSLPYMSTAISALEALTGRSMRLRDAYSETGRELSVGERLEAILNGLPAGGPFAKVAHYAGRIMLAKAALEVTTGMDLSGPGLDAIIAGKPRWLTADERAQRALHGAAMHIAYSALGAIQGTVANRKAIDQTFRAEPHQWRDPGRAPDASEAAAFGTMGRTIVDKAARLGEALLTSGMRPGAPQLVYHEGAPLVAEMHEGAAPARRADAGGEPPAARDLTVERGVEGENGRPPRATYRREPTADERAEAWQQADAMAAYWEKRGVAPPEFTANMDHPTAWIHETDGSPTQLRRINLGYNLAPARDPAGVPLEHRANAALSPRAATGHEGGHYEAFVADKVHPLHEETQASLRGAIHMPALPLSDRSALIRDAAARLGHHEQGTPVAGREHLRSRWQRPTLVLPPGLWLEAIDFRSLPPRGPAPAASGPRGIEVRHVESSRRRGPPPRAAAPADKAGQPSRSAAEEARDAFRRAGEKLANLEQNPPPRQPTPQPQRSRGASPPPPKEAPAPSQPRQQPARSADAQRSEDRPPPVKLSPRERADLDAKIVAACKQLPYLSKQLELSRSRVLYYMKRIEAGEPDAQPSVVNNELTDGHHRLIASLILKKPVEVSRRSEDPAMRQLSKAAHEMAVRIAEALGTPPPKVRPLRPIKNADFVLVD